MNRLKKRIEKIFDKNKKELRLLKNFPNEFQVATHFKQTLIKRGFILSIDHWDKTLNAVKEIGLKHKDVSKEDWIGCIDWCFDKAVKKADWVQRVPVNHLGTVIKLYNEYKRSEERKTDGRKRFNRY